MQLRHQFIVGMFGLGIASAASLAGTVSYNTNYGPVAIPNSSAVVGTLPLWNPALFPGQTLVQVTFTLDSNTSQGSITFDNEAGVGTDVTVGIGATVNANAMGLLATITNPLQTGSGSAGPDSDGAADFVGADSFGTIAAAGSDSDLDSSTAPATLLAFTGAGNFNVNLGTTTSTFLSTNGGFGPVDAFPGITDGIATVTYDYVPEPASLMLLAGSLLLIRRKR